MRLRQFVFVASDLERAVADISSVLGIEVCFKDPGVKKFGLDNALLPVNGNFIEVVAPIEANTAAGRHLERRAGDGGYMVILQCADMQRERARMESLGIRGVWDNDTEEAASTHYHPADVPGAILSLDTMYPGSNYHREMSYWRWAGPDWDQYVCTNATQALTGITIQGNNPLALANKWSLALEAPVVGSKAAPYIEVDNAVIKFVEPIDTRCVGIAAIDVLPQDRRAIRAVAEARGLVTSDGHIQLCGVQVNLI